MTHRIARRHLLALPALALPCLSGCGGGGGDAPASNPRSADPPPPAGPDQAPAGEPNQPPVLLPIADLNTPIGVATVCQLEAQDADDLELTFKASGVPPGLTLDPRAGRITGVPLSLGQFTTTAEVWDARGKSSARTFRWTVHENLNPVQRENAKTASDGVSTDWEIREADLAQNQEIEGYASLNSVPRGGTIDLFVNVKDTSADPHFTLSVYRMGWYGGAGARQVFPTVTLPSRTQPAANFDASTRTVECDWTHPYSLQIPYSSDPTVAMSGVYLVKLTTARGRSRYIIFVVRDDDRRADFMFQTSVTTYAAYNRWGGYSFYTDTPSYAASFNRPYDNMPWDLGPHRSLKGAGDFLRWEIHAVRFLERNGYDVTYSTNIDTHRDPERLKQFKGFLSVGHDEYWSRGMYDAVVGARDAGVHLAFLGANNAYWQVRLEPSAQGVADRRVVCYKYYTSLDPQRHTATVTGLWRQGPLNRPEAGLIGVQYDYNTVDLDMVMSDCSNWLCEGTGLQSGDRLPGLLGYEVDRVEPGVSPDDILVLTQSPYVADGQTRHASMTYYTHSSGAGVFATGSMQWNWGLDALGPYPERASDAAQQITRNVLNRALAPR